jgi:hypothetical protein
MNAFSLLLVAAAQAATPAAAAPAWVNLGAVDGGQGISIDTASVQVEGPARSAWFRVANPRFQGSQRIAYRFRIDCTDRTVQSLAFRQYGPDGSVALEAEYGPAGQGPRAAEPGSLMEVAYHALCT